MARRLFVRLKGVEGRPTIEGDHFVWGSPQNQIFLNEESPHVSLVLVDAINPGTRHGFWTDLPGESHGQNVGASSSDVSIPLNRFKLGREGVFHVYSFLGDAGEWWEGKPEEWRVKTTVHYRLEAVAQDDSRKSVWHRGVEHTLTKQQYHLARALGDVVREQGQPTIPNEVNLDAFKRKYDSLREV